MLCAPEFLGVPWIIFFVQIGKHGITLFRNIMKSYGKNIKITQKALRIKNFLSYLQIIIYLHYVITIHLYSCRT